MPKKNQTSGKVYRYEDFVAMCTLSKDGAETCPTVYLPPEMAIAMGKALIEAGQDCQKYKFTDSKLPEVSVEA